MNHNTTPPEFGPSTRPSLFGPATQAPDPATAGSHEPVRILSSIDSTHKPAPGAGTPAARRSPVMLALGVMALAGLLTVAYLAFGSGRQAPADIARGSPAAPALAAASAASAPATAAASTGPAEAPQAARIENVVVAAAPVPQAAGPAASVPAAKASGENHPFDSLAERKSETVAVAAPARRATAARHTEHSTAVASAPAAVSKARTTPAAGSKIDADIDLLEAMVSHLSGRRPGQRTGAPAAGAADQGRDVVTQQDPPLSTAELVRRCMTLGWLESQLCRTRICDGQWGRDAACPARRQDDDLLR
ncbi:hypothetical protein [Eleftheria terrae]|uniref:hypothetical protein n=1 Tax=Eleftheria terrae TaxID=1597781 RepID=UPI00263ABBC5|nr:hypothetical protein [Eleftheria terrae]WKB52776.1 hypothetical protein N7L95_23865 [Eleftheria terrae]